MNCATCPHIGLYFSLWFTYLLKSTNKFVQNILTIEDSTVKMNSSFEERLNIFDEVYEMRAGKFAGIVISILNILLLSPMLCSIVWFEKFIADKRKMRQRDRQMFFKMGQTRPLFCLFSFFSHDKYSTNTINEKA